MFYLEAQTIIKNIIEYIDMEKPNVFTDFHHAGLLHSLILLFEKRLGGNLYRPIGKDWFDKGFWKVYDHPATVEQFLGIGGATPDNTPPLNDVIYRFPIQENAIIYFCKDIDSDRTNKAITYNGFMAMKIDIVIATLPYHIEPFKRLCALHPNKPKLIYQIGNAWTVDAGMAPNVMASAIIDNVPPNINFITYHQEFDLSIFKHKEPYTKKKISSLVNCFNTADHFKADWNLFTKIEKLMPEWEFRSYGGQGRDGCMHGNQQVADAIADSRFIWHTKNGGDGYGHIAFNIGAVGRPMIVKKEYYQNKLAEKLMIDGETCIAIDNLSIEQIINKIEHYNADDKYSKMCQNVYSNFQTTVNFDKEELSIKNFISKLATT